MSETDDWAPLPGGHAAAHPGEFVPVPARLPRVEATGDVLPPPSEPVAAPTARQAPVDDAEAERALAALRAKLAQVPAGCSLLTEVTRREDRAQRKRRAANSRDLAPWAPVRGESPPLPVDYAVGSDGRDPREEEPWFRELPEAERERLHREWTAERTRHLREPVRQAKRVWRAMAEGAFVMGVLAVLQALVLGGFGTLPLLAGGGALAAGVGAFAGLGRFGYAALGGAVWFAIMLPGILRGDFHPYVMPGLLMAAYGMGALGMAEEMRRSGGFADD